MRVSLATAGVIVLLLGVAPASSQSAIPSDLSGAVRAVVVVNRGTGQFLRLGTAFHVGGGNFYTNAHIVRAPLPEGFTDFYLASTTATASMATWTGPATCICVHRQWRSTSQDTQQAYPYDVATLQVERSDRIPALRLAIVRPQMGQRARVVGFPAASWGWPPIMYVASGWITAVDVTRQQLQVDINAGFAMEGSSGSPVLNDRDEVIGLVHARDGERGSGAADRMFAIHPDAIRTVCN